MEFILLAVSLGILALSVKGVYALLHEQLDERIYWVNSRKNSIQKWVKAGNDEDDLQFLFDRLRKAESKVTKFEKIPDRLTYIYTVFCILVYSAAVMDILTINVDW